MELIKIHYTPSKEIKDYKEIETEVAQLKKFLIEADKKRQCFAIHHAQVHAHPFNFFVVHPRYCLGDNRLFEHNVIINPKIIEQVEIKKPSYAECLKDKVYPADTPEAREAYARFPEVHTTRRVDEGCMSFPFRAAKKVERAWAVKIEYQYYNGKKLETVKTQLDNTAGQIFQHECDHAAGKNIYFTH